MDLERLQESQGEQQFSVPFLNRKTGMAEKKNSDAKHTSCTDASFLWFKWKRHAWKRIDLPAQFGRFDIQKGVEKNCVFFRKSEFDDGFHGIFYLYQAAHCECGEIKLIPTSNWTAFRTPFDSREEAIEYIKTLVDRRNNDND